MARVEGAIICLLILAIDVAAGVLGIEAEMAENKVKSFFKINRSLFKVSPLF